MKVSDGNLVLTPELDCAIKTTKKMITPLRTAWFVTVILIYLWSCFPAIVRHFSMKLLCVRVRKSTRAVVHTPASEVVGTRYSIFVSSVIIGA